MNKNELLAKLSSVNGIVSGQHIGACRSQDMQMVTGLSKVPGFVEAELGWSNFGVWPEQQGNFSEQAASRLANLYEQGVMIGFCWHMQNPWTLRQCSDDITTGNLHDLWTPGSSGYDQFNKMLDRVHYALNWFTSRGIPILARLLHEMNGEWMWHENRPQSEFVQLWQYVYGKLSDLDLIRVYSANRQFGSLKAASYYYPGKDWVDILGIDHYARLNDSEWSWVDSSWNELNQLAKANGHLMALSENGCGDGSRARTGDYSNFMELLSDHCPDVKYFSIWWQGYALINQRNVNTVFNQTVNAGWLDNTEPEPPEPEPEPPTECPDISELPALIGQLEEIAATSLTIANKLRGIG